MQHYFCACNAIFLLQCKASLLTNLFVKITIPFLQCANGEPVLKGSSSYFPAWKYSICCLTYKQRGEGSDLTSKASPNFTKWRKLTNAFVRIILSSIPTNRAKCTFYKKFLDLLDEESISGWRIRIFSLPIRREFLLWICQRRDYVRISSGLT